MTVGFLLLMKIRYIHGFFNLSLGLNKLGSNDLHNQNNSDYKDDGSLRSETTGEKTFEISEVIISDDSSDNTCRIVDEIAAQNPSLSVD